jgi:CRP/FNR family transcriptional regulator, cyclic AMP receptor protein
VRRQSRHPKRRRAPEFSVQAFVESAGVAKAIVRYRRGAATFRQGDVAEHVWYFQAGRIKLSIQSKSGKEAVVAMLGPGDYFGEGCLAGQPLRMGSATTVTPSTVLGVDKRQMGQLLHQRHELSDRFIAHMLMRNIRIEEDLVDQLFNSSEKRLARTLLMRTENRSRRLVSSPRSRRSRRWSVPRARG